MVTITINGRVEYAYEKLKRVINSCTTKAHIWMTEAMIDRFGKIHGKDYPLKTTDGLRRETIDNERRYFYNLLTMLKQHRKRINK